MTLWLFSHSRIRFKNGLPCCLSPWWLLSSFYHRVSFSLLPSLLPLLSSAQLPLSCSINLTLLMNPFMCRLNRSALLLLLGFYFEFWRQFLTCYFLTPCNSFINLVAELTLEIQNKNESHHFVIIIKFYLLCCTTSAKNSTCHLFNTQYIFVE